MSNLKNKYKYLILNIYNTVVYAQHSDDRALNNSVYWQAIELISYLDYMRSKNVAERKRNI